MRRSVYEYQFPHDQSSIRYNTHGKVAQNHFHDVPIDDPSARAPSSACGNEKLSGVHGVQGQLLRGCRAPQDARERPGVSTSPGDDDSLQQRDSLMSMRLNSQQVGYPANEVEIYPVMSDRKILYNDSSFAYGEEMEGASKSLTSR